MGSEEIMSPPEKKLKDSSEPGSPNAEDRISALPNSLLHHILSFLEMKEVMATSLLSRRWQYLWTSTPTLDFGKWKPNTIDRVLVLYEGTMIRKFRVCFSFENLKYDATSHINSWIRLAVRHGVEELNLDLSGGGRGRFYCENLYRLPRCLFACGSIEVLRLRLCILNLPNSVHLHLLKTLELFNLELTDLEIKALTSGCPLLENMALVDCNDNNNLNIFAPNRNMKSLRIHNTECTVKGVEIFAPFLLSLQLGGFMRTYYTIRDLSSVVSANIEFETLDCFDYHGEDDPFVQLLSDLSHVKTLKLGDQCVKDLTLRELAFRGSLDFQATCLELKTALSKWDQPGLAYLLRSFRHLESLVIEFTRKETCYLLSCQEFWRSIMGKYKKKRKYWKLLELSLSCHFSHLRTLKIYGFMGSKYIPYERQGTKIDDLVEKRQSEVELIKFFLTNCKMLDKITISTTKTAVLSDAMKSELLLNVTNRLIPRVSQNPKIVFS